MSLRPSPSLRFTFFLLTMMTLLTSPASSLAQKYKEIEIEVAGPWAYITDPSDPNRIVVLSPNVNHAMDVLESGNANGFTKQMAPGRYSLKFDTGKCATHYKVARPNLLEFTTDPTSNAVSNALGATNKRFAVSLPKPCYYETYLESRSKVDSSSINPGTPEQTYTIWMALHYTVTDATTSAELSGTLDSGAPFPSTKINFGKSSWPPSPEAISVVSYYANVGEDYLCDSYSAHHFDAALSLLGQSALHRLFPEMDASGKQTNRYNYAPVCPETRTKETHSSGDSSVELRNRVVEIRKYLTDQKESDAIADLKNLRGQLPKLWKPKAPEELLDDLEDSVNILERIKDGHTHMSRDAISEFMKITYFFLAPGRADCHAMQLNVDNTVP
jgi:hypothetical protein